MKVNRKLSIAANSLAYYLLSYFFVFIVHQAFTILAARLFRFNIELNYTNVKFLVSRYEWYFD